MMGILAGSTGGFALLFRRLVSGATGDGRLEVRGGDAIAVRRVAGCRKEECRRSGLPLPAARGGK
jgi:hypothetical protein